MTPLLPTMRGNLPIRRSGMPADSSVSSSATSTRSDALALQGRMLSVTRVRVLNPDVGAIRAQLSAWAAQMPQAVRGMAVVVDSDVETDLGAVLEQLREVGMQPVGVSEGPLAQAARAAGLAVLPPDNGRNPKARAETSARPKRQEAAAQQAKAAAADPPPAVAHAAARTVLEPVRSGQQIHAQNSDLIVLSSVSAGAELIADGCIHVYGRLSGRAIAGASGDESARIFCSRLEAELLAVAGIYAVAEQIQEAPRGAPAQAWLDNGELRIESLV